MLRRELAWWLVPAAPQLGGRMSACDDCLRRAALIAALAGRLQIEFKQRTAPPRVLALADAALLDLAGSAQLRRRHARFDAPAARAAASAAGLATVPRCPA